MAEGTPAELKATVGTEVLAVRMADPAQTREAAGLLSDLSTGESPAVDLAAGEVRLPVADPGASAAALRRLDEHQLAVAAIELHRPSLDDVFLSLTGRPAGDGPPIPRPCRRPHEHRRPRDPSPRLGLADVISDSRVLAGRQLRKTLRRPMYVVFSFVQPVIFVLLFRYVFGGAIHTGRVSYVNFLIPGIIVQTAIFGSLITGLGITEDLAAGVVDRFRSLPIARSAVLIGRTVADMVINVLTLIVMLLVGLLVGFRPIAAGLGRGAGAVLVLGFSYVFSWISAFVGLAVKNPETAQSAGFIWVFPLTFASSAFVPTASMPSVVHAFADVNPVTLAVNAVRALTVGQGSAAGPALGTLAWMAGLLLVFVPLSVRAFRRA